MAGPEPGRPCGMRPGPGVRAFSPSAVRVQVTALACTLPRDSGKPLSRWSVTELARAVIQRGIVRRISPGTVSHVASEDHGGQVPEVAPSAPAEVLTVDAVWDHPDAPPETKSAEALLLVAGANEDSPASPKVRRSTYPRPLQRQPMEGALSGVASASLR